MTKRKRRQRSKRIPVRVRERADGRTVLEVDGVVQSILVQPEDDASACSELGYWAAMLPPDAAPPPRRALLLGLGGGTVAALLARRFPDIAMVGIESDAGVLALARRDMGLDAVPGLTVVCADAFAWVAAAAESEPGGYEYIALDLYLAGRLVAGALARDFLRQVAALLTPAGLLAVNLMVTARTNDHVLRLQQVFYVTRVRQVSGNIVAHLRRADGQPSAGEPAASSMRHA